MIDIAIRTTLAAITVAVSLGAAEPASAQSGGGGPLVTIPLSDGSGTVRAFMSYRRNPNGRSQIFFVDAETRSQINSIPAGGVGGGGGDASALSGFAPLPPLDSLPEVPTGCGTGGGAGAGAGARGRRGTEAAVGRPGTASANPGAGRPGIICSLTSDVALLQVQVNQLRSRLQEVTERLNAASRR